MPPMLTRHAPREVGHVDVARRIHLQAAETTRRGGSCRVRMGREVGKSTHLCCLATAPRLAGVPAACLLLRPYLSHAQAAQVHAAAIVKVNHAGCGCEAGCTERHKMDAGQQLRCCNGRGRRRPTTAGPRELQATTRARYNTSQLAWLLPRELALPCTHAQALKSRHIHYCNVAILTWVV